MHPDRTESVYGALYCEGRPRSRWLRLISRRVDESQLRARGPMLPADVFEQLAGRYLLDALAGRARADLPPEAWLWKRFSWDVHRAAESIVRHATLLEGDWTDQIAPPSPLDVHAEAMAAALMRRVLELVDDLPAKESQAVFARLACDMDPERVYELLGLPKGSRCRANHNQAFTAGVAKLRRLLHREGWLELDADR